MKTKFLGYTLMYMTMYLFLTITSCQKREIENKSEIKLKSERIDFMELMTAVRDASIDLNNRGNNCENSLNPFDHHGIEHNSILSHLHDIEATQGDLSHLISEFEDHTNLEVYKSPSYFEQLVSDIKSEIYDSNYEYIPDFMNSFQGRLPQLEINIVNSYFETIAVCDTLDVRINMSKAAESFVINSDSLTSESKDRMLLTFALYRHSTCFWDSEQDDDRNPLKMCDIFDAIGAYIAMNDPDIPVGVIENGAEVNEFASLFSAVCCAVLGFWI
jgi:hypothetical protein